MPIFQTIIWIVFLAGYGTLDYPNTTIEELIDDAKRVEYMSSYLDALLRAKRYNWRVVEALISSIFHDEVANTYCLFMCLEKEQM